jgi:hypothetical protein
MSRPFGPRGDERGSGLLGAVLGVAIVAAMLGFSVNLLLGLWTRSTVDAVAYDAARDIATAPSTVDPDTAARTSVERARALLGEHGERVTFDVAVDDQSVTLRVRSPGVGLMPALIDGGPMVGSIDRRIVIRRESP